MKHADFLEKIDDARIAEAIAAAGANTTGVVRLLVSKRHCNNPITAAEEHFHALGLDRRALQNAILIFVAPSSHTFAIYGGSAIHQRVGPKAWAGLSDETGRHLKDSRFTDALVYAISRAGELLTSHFPRD